MTTLLNIADFDVVFLSYDEPNANSNWNDLITKIPHAQRVHGVKGSDSAHKAVAQLATTDRVIVIDADNIIQDNFLDQIIEIDDSIDASSTVFSWPSLNVVNGLLYGNGGIKCWPRQAMLDMRTHEISDIDNELTQIDFCWALTYIPIDTCFSKTHNNNTKLQAWRAGFREGVKMCLDQGKKIPDLSSLDLGNLNRLRIWMTVGLDAANGIWAILGARQGCYLTQFTDWDHVQVRDFDYLKELYNTNIISMTETDASNEITELGEIISTQLSICAPYNPDQSLFFKNFNINPDRQPSTIKASNQDNVNALLINLEDAFSAGQHTSKKWMVDELMNLNLDLGTVFICAGWYATAVQMLFESHRQIEKIRSFDIDLNSTRISEILNKQWVIDNWKFKACTSNIHNLDYQSCNYTVNRADGTTCDLIDTPTTIINTSCEHIENFSAWWEALPSGVLVVVQSNDGFDIDGHVNCSKSMTEFAKITPMSKVLYHGEKPLPKFTRFMRIGIK